MKFVMFQDIVSPHQVPLAREIAGRVGAGNFRYVYRDEVQENRAGLGWSLRENDPWLLHAGRNPDEVRDLVENAECLLTMFRDVDLIERRWTKGLKTYVQTERWFKPRAGFLRMVSRSYHRMARRFVRLMREGAVMYLPMGIYAARDMARLCGLISGDMRCLFTAPKLDYEHEPTGRITFKGGGYGIRYGLNGMRMWGYYVAPSDNLTSFARNVHDVPNPIRVLWVGRMLKLKRVDTIIRAVCEYADSRRNDSSLPEMTLDIYGIGPEEVCLKMMAENHADIIRFHPPVPILKVRGLMREHDVYVLTSNGYEGWGAVVSEALEEGMRVLGTYEAGSSATILPNSCLFHAGDWRGLSGILKAGVPRVSAGKWTARYASARLLQLVNG